MSDATALVLAVVLLAANAFFVGAEFALVSARRTQIDPGSLPAPEPRDHARRDGERVDGDGGRAARHHRLLARAGRHRRAGRRAPPRACLPRPRRSRRPASPGLVHDRPVRRGLPPRRARRDGPQEHRARRAQPGGAAARTADGRIASSFSSRSWSRSTPSRTGCSDCCGSPRGTRCRRPSRTTRSPPSSTSRGTRACSARTSTTDWPARLGFTERTVEAVLLPRHTLATVRRGATVREVEELCAATG